MLNLEILDILIAMVVVILVLSLVVQSIQTFMKKALKLKSRSIQSSLVDLFETIGKRPAAQTIPAAAAASGATTESATTTAPSPPNQSAEKLRTPRQLVADVTDQLKDMGRKTLFGNPMLDSLAKSDLLKVVARVKANDLIPGTVTAYSGLLTGIDELKTEIGNIKTEFLQGEASAKFAAMQSLVMPVLHDLEALASGGKIDPAVFFGDLYKLRQIKTADVLAILGQVQQTVSVDLAAARNSGEATRIETLTDVDTGLKDIAKKISTLSTQFDAALAPLVARLEQVDAWYDTVMQGFDERYTRHMKTWGIAISIGVVVFLNANFFSIYRSLKADPAMTQAIGQQVPAILKKVQDEKAQQTATPTPAVTPAGIQSSAATPPTTTPGATSPAASPPAGNATAAGTPSPSPTPPETPPTVADVQEAGKNVKELVSTYESFGIKPLSRQQISDAFNGRYKWRDLSETFFGWALMVALLSAGAPFWEDTLESLFGIKNLIRQKSGTKNIEEDKGGQPKP
jgi:hypothetical protein